MDENTIVSYKLVGDKHRQWRKIYSCIAFLLLSSCARDSKDSNSSKDVMTVEKFAIKEGSKISPNDWTCYNVQYDKICCPKKWNAIGQSKALFLARPDTSNENSFFVVMRHDEVVNKLTIANYLKEVSNQLINDTTDRLTGSSVKKLVYKDREVYSAEFTTTLNKKDYFMFAMNLSLNGMIYDLTLRIPREHSNKYYEIFQNILYNYESNGIRLFKKGDKLLEVQEINISDM